jgi:hypothetical protein
MFKFFIFSVMFTGFGSLELHAQRGSAKDIKSNVQNKVADAVDFCFENPNHERCKSEKGEDKTNKVINNKIVESMQPKRTVCDEKPGSDECKAFMKQREDDDASKTRTLSGLVGGFADIKNKKQDGKVAQAERQVDKFCTAGPNHNKEMCDRWTANLEKLILE